MKQISVLHQYYNKITFLPIFSIENILFAYISLTKTNQNDLILSR